MTQRIIEILKRHGIAEDKAAEIAAEIEKPPMSPWWNSKARWDQAKR